MHTNYCICHFDFALLKWCGGGNRAARHGRSGPERLKLLETFITQSSKTPLQERFIMHVASYGRFKIWAKTMLFCWLFCANSRLKSQQKMVKTCGAFSNNPPADPPGAGCVVWCGGDTAWQLPFALQSYFESSLYNLTKKPRIAGQLWEMSCFCSPFVQILGEKIVKLSAKPKAPFIVSLHHTPV